jgi:hypothetical protein
LSKKNKDGAFILEVYFLPGALVRLLAAGHGRIERFVLLNSGIVESHRFHVGWDLTVGIATFEQVISYVADTLRTDLIALDH